MSATPQEQRSLMDQLGDLHAYATHHGLYDAADFLRRQIDLKEPAVENTIQKAVDAIFVQVARKIEMLHAVESQRRSMKHNQLVGEIRGMFQAAGYILGGGGHIPTNTVRGIFKRAYPDLRPPIL